MSKNFIHLHVHSDYTLSYGASKIKNLVATAKTYKMPAIALADEINMYGAMDFSSEASSAGIQPIIGIKLWYEQESNVVGSIMLYAMNEVGYINICKILKLANHPKENTLGNLGIATYDMLKDHTDGVIVLTGGYDGVLNNILRVGKDIDKEKNNALEILNKLRYLFDDRLYVEICRHGNENDTEILLENKLLDLVYNVKPIVTKYNNTLNYVPIVATTEIWYSTEDQHGGYEILKAVIDKGTHVNIEQGEITPSTHVKRHMRSIDEMYNMFFDLPEAIDNTVLIAKRCGYKTPYRKPILPPFKTEGGISEAEEMNNQAIQGLKDRLAVTGCAAGYTEKDYFDRLKFEVDIINKMEFPGYFLIVSDFIKWSKDNDIPVGPGRGSGAGSLVAYSLKITDIDPLRWGLLFERFLNPDRVSMPDFDVDFCQDRRGEVIHYIKKKYGEDYVSMIATFNVIKSKSAIKDAGRVLNSDEYGTYSYGEIDRINKIIPYKGAEPKPLIEALEDEESPMFGQQIRKDPKLHLLFNNALKIEKLYRQQSIHAAGVVITGQPMDTLVPTGWDNKSGMPVCQFNMKHTENSGLVKFDFLGLKNLSVIQECLKNIKATTGDVIDILNIDLSCQETYGMLSEGYTNGVFQFESDGMKKWFRALKPTKFEDLIALVSLYRPGPMDMIPHFVDCKNGRATPSYPEPAEKTKLFLEETHGIMVYQEQVMQVAQVVAGYTLGGADLLRRAMGKKIQSEMDEQRQIFIQGAMKNGTPAETANKLFDTIDKFAGYGFNKSHAAAYAFIAYQTAWLKRHYPAQFLAAVLTYEVDPDKMAKIKEDMTHFKIDMLLPNIDKSHFKFMPEWDEATQKYHIRFGLKAIKTINPESSNLLQEQKKGPFKDLLDFYQRSGHIFNSSQRKHLVMAGAFDDKKYGKNRASIDSVLEYLGKNLKISQNNANMDLFGGSLEIAIPKDKQNLAEWGNVTEQQYNAVGFYFGKHPLESYEARFMKLKVKRRKSLMNWMKEKQIESLNAKKMAGMVEFVEKKISKKNSNVYISLKISEINDTYYVNFYQQDYHPEYYLDQIFDTIMEAKQSRVPVIVEGRVSLNDYNGEENLTIWADKVFNAEQLSSENRGNLVIKLDTDKILPTSEMRKELREIKDLNPVEQQAEQKKIMQKFAMKKINVLQTIINNKRADEDKNATSIEVITIINGQEQASVLIDGSYLIDQAVENAIKSTDGVVSFQEKFINTNQAH